MGLASGLLAAGAQKNISSLAQIENRSFAAPSIVVLALVRGESASSKFTLRLDNPVPLSEIEFQQQKQMFEDIPPLLKEPYKNQFVASRDGRIVDSDEDFVVLTQRFFGNAGDVPVYITKIGEDEGISIETPFPD